MCTALPLSAHTLSFVSHSEHILFAVDTDTYDQYDLFRFLERKLPLFELYTVGAQWFDKLFAPSNKSIMIRFLYLSASLYAQAEHTCPKIEGGCPCMQRRHQPEAININNILQLR